MSRARDIGKGDVIVIKGGRKVTVTRVTQPELGMVLIEWERGSASGVMGRGPDADVKRVYKPKPRWSW